MTRQIHFIFLGKSIPKYALSSLRIAKETGNLEIHLICNETTNVSLGNYVDNITYVESFYDNNDFDEAKKNLLVDSSFRNGFWLKTLERFFVIEQFMEATKLNSLFHAELDQLLFRVDVLLANVELSQFKGIFFPYHNDRFVVASLLYCNDIETIKSLTRFAKEFCGYSNEMQLLSEWSKSYSEKVFWLPTLGTLKKTENVSEDVKGKLLPVAQIGGLVDAAQIGQWVAGIDPRNVPVGQRPRTGFVDQPEPTLLSQEDLENLRFNFDPESSFLKLRVDSINEYPLYNLHIHSKIHPWLEKSLKNFQKLIASTNQRRRIVIPGTRRIQFLDFVKELIRILYQNPEKVIVLFKRTVFRISRFTPSSHPFITIDLFRDALNKHHSNYGKERETRTGIEYVYWAGADVFKLLDFIAQNCRSKNVRIVAPELRIENDLKLDEKVCLPNNVKVFSCALASDRGFEYLPLGIESFRRGNHSVRDLNLRVDSSAKKEFTMFWIQSHESISTSYREFITVVKNLPYGTLLENPTAKRRKEMYLRNLAFIPYQHQGQDIHWIWEAMYFKCMPILVRNRVSMEMFRLGLPVVLINNIEELREWNIGRIENTYRSNIEKFKAEPLFFDFWFERIFRPEN